MAELEVGNPDELIRTLRNWIRQASDPIAALPTGTDRVGWAVRRFIVWWIARCGAPFARLRIAAPLTVPAGEHA
jgi:hypothetical protein